MIAQAVGLSNSVSGRNRCQYTKYKKSARKIALEIGKVVYLTSSRTNSSSISLLFPTFVLVQSVSILLVLGVVQRIVEFLLCGLVQRIFLQFGFFVQHHLVSTSDNNTEGTTEENSKNCGDKSDNRHCNSKGDNDGFFCLKG